jgi:enoyl-[acyl-carrier-protein] reductase (NADH)
MKLQLPPSVEAWNANARPTRATRSRGLSDEKIAAVAGDDAPTAQAAQAAQAALEMIAGMAALRRAPRLADVAEVAAFLASDRAGGMTGTMANVTSGLVLG